jgi:DNA transposition AAA+ family ATPase
MTENVIEILEVRHDIDVLLETARAGVTALETASTKIHIPTREMAKIQTAMRKMREAANYVENRAHNLSVKPDKITKTALKEALKDASQEQIERAYTILSGLDDAYETAKEESVEDVEIDDEDFLPPPEWDEE